MKLKLMLGCCLLTMLFLALPAHAGVTTYNVHALTLSGNGLLEDTTVEPPEIVKLKLSENDLANLALGQFPGSFLPANTVLAWAQDCLASDFRIVLFNTATQSVIEEVARVVDSGGVVAKGKGTFVMAMELEEVGDEDNGINGGVLALSGKFKELEGCPDGISASVFAILHVKFTTFDTFDVDIIVPKGKLNVGEQIGTWSP